MVFTANKAIERHRDQPVDFIALVDLYDWAFDSPIPERSVPLVPGLHLNTIQNMNEINQELQTYLEYHASVHRGPYAPASVLVFHFCPHHFGHPTPQSHPF